MFRITVIIGATILSLKKFWVKIQIKITPGVLRVNARAHRKTVVAGV